MQVVSSSLWLSNLSHLVSVFGLLLLLLLPPLSRVFFFFLLQLLAVVLASVEIVFDIEDDDFFSSIDRMVVLRWIASPLAWVAVAVADAVESIIIVADSAVAVTRIVTNTNTTTTRITNVMIIVWTTRTHRISILRIECIILVIAIISVPCFSFVFFPSFGSNQMIIAVINLPSCVHNFRSHICSLLFSRAR